MSKENWYLKLKSYVPEWLFQENKNADAQFMAMASLIDQIQLTISDHLKETFIETSSEKFLNLLGEERNKIRKDQETDQSYRPRIREIVNSSNLPALKALIDSYLINGESTIIEHHAAENFCDVGAYVDRNIISIEDFLYNFFTVLVFHQIPKSETFIEVDAYCDSGFMVGAIDSDLSLFKDIVQAINENKALGVEYRLIERISEA